MTWNDIAKATIHQRYPTKANSQSSWISYYLRLFFDRLLPRRWTIYEISWMKLLYVYWTMQHLTYTQLIRSFSFQSEKWQSSPSQYALMEVSRTAFSRLFVAFKVKWCRNQASKLIGHSSIAFVQPCQKHNAATKWVRIRKYQTNSISRKILFAKTALAEKCFCKSDKHNG